MMGIPKTIARTYPYRAAVIFEDGDSKTTQHMTQDDASDWIDRQYYKFGNHIVASDIFPNGM